jgi:hypothetical protein
MKRSDRSPKARQSQLVIKELASETLVYDESNHQAHCLNQTAAFVWKHCDGRRSIRTLARLMEKEMNAGVSEQTVRFAIKQLEQSRLLEASPPGSSWLPQTSRRELIRTLGVAAVALPIIVSVVAPRAAAAASCVLVGQPCTGIGQGTCCPGLVCCGTCFNGQNCP